MKKRLLLRCFLAVLILLNLWMIYSLSGEDGKQSGETSKKVTQTLATVVVKDFQEKPLPEQDNIVLKMHPSVRSMAHMAEFGSLGCLVMLFVLTFRLSPLLSGGISMLSVLVVAVIDELYQHFAKAGRAGEVKDVGLDCLGALIACSVLLALICLFKFIRMKNLKKPLKVTSYSMSGYSMISVLRIALVSDLHDNPADRVIDALRSESPNLILVPGDLTDDIHIRRGAAETLAFLRECVAIAPTFYSLGNHEIGCYHAGNPFRKPTPVPLPEDFKEALKDAGVVLLDNTYTEFEGVTIFGLTSGINKKENRPDPEVLRQFAEVEGRFKILLCHHPEYYIPYLKDLDMDLVVSGHAHGGHWRFFDRGVYAPGQGLFPKYTSGMIDKKLVISRGLGDHTSIPRIFNPPELVMVNIGGDIFKYVFQKRF